MRRAALGALLLILLPVAHGSLASATPGATPSPTITTFNGYCFTSPYTTLLNCTTPTPTATPLVPVKTLSVGPPVPAPAGTTSYPVQITSRLACFSLDEPINLYALGSPDAAALTVLDPLQTENGAHALTLHVNPDSGQATLSLEVMNAGIGAPGLLLKAVWPQEGEERVAVIATPSGTITPSPIPTPSATPPVPPTPSAPAVAACTEPRVVAGSSIGPRDLTLFARTLPGSLCTPAVTYYLNGHLWRSATAAADNLDPTPRPTGPDGIVSYPFTANTVADFGIATVTCLPPTGPSLTACTAFLIAQHVGDYNTSALLTQPLATTIRQTAALQTQYCPA